MLVMKGTRSSWHDLSSAVGIESGELIGGESVTSFKCSDTHPKEDNTQLWFK